MNKSTASAALIAAAAFAMLTSGQGLPPGPMPTPTATVNVGPAVAAKAANPAPTPAAKNQSQKTTIGKSPASVTASAPSAYWTDLVDIDADGVEEDNQFLLDQKRGILYTYREDNYQCADGSSQNGEVLMGIYVKGNQAGKPIGSGWYVVAVKAGQCGEKKPGLFGCWFDAKGKPTSCGSAHVKEDSGELDLVLKKNNS
jgi:hypothetical protein